MNVLFEEDGAFKAGVVRDAPGTPEASTLQVELATGRRIKIKSRDVVLEFAQPTPDALLHDADALAKTLDVVFLWEVAPTDEFDALALGAEYFGATPTPVQATAVLMCVQGAPIYFRRRGKGRYRPAPREEVDAALAGLERKRQQAVQQTQLAEHLVAGRLPAGWAEPAGAGLPRAAWLLFKPDKNSLEWKALDQAAREAHLSPERVLLRAGAFADAHAMHRARFIVEWFPKGTDAVAPPATFAADGLPLADVQAFSIDDSQTTEIDDAFSVRPLDDATVRIGIHIAAPAAFIAPGDAIDALARKRLSTVYMPGEKITMLPDPTIAAFTLAEGAPRPAVSLYADFVLETGVCIAQQSRLERVAVAANLRHDVLDAIVTEATLDDDVTDFAFKPALRTLWRLAQRLSAQRDEVRGKPEPRNRTDYAFRIEHVGDDTRVRIEPRKRDAPLDRLVAEWMIFANSTWGRRLAEAGVPGIYRVQTHWARPGARQSAVRMTTQPDRHLGMGVSNYAWSSSPLRRYVDLVNQWQLLAVLRLQRPPFEQGSAELFAIVGAFEAAYAAYADVQSRMERYWCLRWLTQQALVGHGRTVAAVVARDERVRMTDLPLVAPLAGIGHLAPGTHVDVEVLAVDEVDLTLQLRLVAVRAEAVEADDAVDVPNDDVPNDQVPNDEVPNDHASDADTPGAREAEPSSAPTAPPAPG